MGGWLSVLSDLAWRFGVLAIVFVAAAIAGFLTFNTPLVLAISIGLIINGATGFLIHGNPEVTLVLLMVGIALFAVSSAFPPMSIGEAFGVGEV